ncbi:hypothetical protein [Taklimakanibacter lacteus]|uniref:hypothetical protein n=1 Tax=Taklimakanibacter lacteus TaxID=2268456 RepID=UPI0013C4F6A9
MHCHRNSGSFLNGFISNAVGAASGMVSNAISQGNIIADTLIVGIAGGTASVLTGGKFANGAITAAFANLWNKCAAQQCTIGEKANAIVNGAYSIFPGVGNALRFMARGIGLFGAEERLKWEQEGKAVDYIAKQMAEDPKFREEVMSKLRVGYDAFETENQELYYFLGGRAVMGTITRLGPAAIIGSTTRAVEDARDLVINHPKEAAVYLLKHGVIGAPK